MEDVDKSIADQNVIIQSMLTSLAPMRERITKLNALNTSTKAEFSDSFKEINGKMATIKELVDKAKIIEKNCKKTQDTVNNLVQEKNAILEALKKKEEEIGSLTERLKKNEATHLEDHDKLSKQQVGLAAANQANLAAKDRADASLAALQQQSTAATQQQQIELQAALQGKTAAEEAQRRAEQEVKNTKDALGTSKQHAAAMQNHMNKLGDLKKHQVDLTGALNALKAEIDAANEDLGQLDASHVQHLDGIKKQLVMFDKNLQDIIDSEPPVDGSGSSAPQPPPAAGSGNPMEMQNRILSRTDGDRDSNVLPSQQIPLLNEGAESVRDPTFDELEAMRVQQPDKFRSLPSNVKQKHQTDTMNRQFQENKDRLSNFSGGKGKGRQRGGYIAVKKTRSKSSSSSGRRGTRRRSSSRSSSTRRKRHRGSSSSTRSSRR